MEAYTSFAAVYDVFMDDVPYEEWCEYVCGILQEYGIRDGLVLDLGCGTGTMTRLLAEQGYDMIGVDCSEDMLELAQEKEAGKSLNILYLLQDMREFELYGTVRAVVCICDSINYILEEEELLQVFRLVNNYLDPGGLFLFDLNTVYKYREVIGDATISQPTTRLPESLPERRANGFTWWLWSRERKHKYYGRLYHTCHSG